MSDADTLSSDDTRAWLDVPDGYLWIGHALACAFTLWMERNDYPRPIKLREAFEREAEKSRAHAVGDYVSPALLRLVLREQAREHGGAAEWLVAMFERLGLAET